MTLLPTAPVSGRLRCAWTSASSQPGSGTASADANTSSSPAAARAPAFHRAARPASSATSTDFAPAIGAPVGARLHDDELVVVHVLPFRATRPRSRCGSTPASGHENDRALRWAGSRCRTAAKTISSAVSSSATSAGTLLRKKSSDSTTVPLAVRPQRHRVQPAVADETHPPHVEAGGGELVEQLAPRGAAGQPAGGTAVIGQHARDELLDAPPVARGGRRSDDHAPGTDEPGDGSARSPAGRRRPARVSPRRTRSRPRPPRRLVSGARARIGTVNAHERAPGQLDRDVAHDEHAGGAGGHQRFEIRPAPALAVRSQRRDCGRASCALRTWARRPRGPAARSERRRRSARRPTSRERCRCGRSVRRCPRRLSHRRAGGDRSAPGSFGPGGSAGRCSPRLRRPSSPSGSSIRPRPARPDPRSSALRRSDIFSSASRIRIQSPDERDAASSRDGSA